MTLPRSALVSVEETPYYHCIGRCVRRAFLCGQDATSGRSYEHRREWIQTRLALLTEIFAIDVAAYAVLSNHYHLVVKLCPARADSLADDEVLRRWARIFRVPALAWRARRGEPLTAAEGNFVAAFVRERRRRLGNLSWFMRSLNEHVSRLANAEDGCTGHFWEGRFRSQALLDEGALLTAMAYVDLNPVRAGTARTVADITFASIHDRLVAERSHQPDGAATTKPCPRLMPFATDTGDAEPLSLPCGFTDYLELLTTTAGAIANSLPQTAFDSVPRLLERLRLDPEEWKRAIRSLHTRFALAIGSPYHLAARS